MAGLHHEYVAGVRAETDVQYSVVGNARSRHANLHCVQAMCDGACGLMCVLQAVMVLTGVPRSRVEALPTAKRGALRRLWTLARDIYFEGTDEAEIVTLVGAFAPDLVAGSLISTSVHRLGAAAAKAIKAGHVPMLRFESRAWSHWATVIGVEVMAGEATPRALLMLDPGAPPPWGGFYNARLDLKAKAGREVRGDSTFNRPYRQITGEAWAVRLAGLVVIKRGQSP